jgi:hypothetical protein
MTDVCNAAYVATMNIYNEAFFAVDGNDVIVSRLTRSAMYDVIHVDIHDVNRLAILNAVRELTL